MVHATARVAREILSFAERGQYWPTGRAANTARVPSDDSGNTIKRINGDGASRIRKEIRAEELVDMLYMARLTDPDTGKPIERHVTIRMENVKVSGKVRFRGEQVSRAIHFLNCTFESGIDFKDSNFRLISFKDCKIKFLSLKRAEIDRSLIIEACTIKKGLNLRGIDVDRSIGLKGTSVFEHTGPTEDQKFLAVDLRYARIGASVFMRDGFNSHGHCDFSGSFIEGKLDCEASAFLGKDDGGSDRLISIRAKNATILGSVYLNRGFSAYGEVDFRRARIGAQFNVCDASLIAGDQDRQSGRFALNLENASIEQDLILQNLSKLDGDIGLQGATARTLSDKPSEWTKPKAEIQGKIWLSGFKYESATVGLNVRAERLDWLQKVLPSHYTGKNFVRNPWYQMADVLREHGHTEEADIVDVDAAANNGRRMISQLYHSIVPVKTRDWWTIPFRLLLSIVAIPIATMAYICMRYGLKFGYGLGYMRGVIVISLLWMVNIAVFGIASYEGRMKPAEEEVVIYVERYGLERAPELYTNFNSIIYGLDVILPIDLSMQRSWLPMNAQDSSLTEEMPDRTADFIGTVKDDLLDSSPRLNEFVGNYQGLLKTLPKWWTWGNIIFGWLAVLMIGATATGRFTRNAERKN